MNTKPQVLVIDDDEVVGHSFDRVLSKKGYEVSTALSGEDGLKNMESKDYDVVFTDIKMPGIGGLEVAERIKARCPWTPVVVITGYGTEEHEDKASVLGVSGFVHKPLTPEIIESITLKALSAPGAAAQAVVEAGALARNAAEETISGLRKAGIVAKNIGLFFAAPFVALGYIIVLPLVGFYMIGKLSTEGAISGLRRIGVLRKAGTAAKNVGLFFAAPFVALGYIIVLPLVGFYMIAKLSIEAVFGRRASG